MDSIDVDAPMELDEERVQAQVDTAAVAPSRRMDERVSAEGRECMRRGWRSDKGTSHLGKRDRP